MLVAQDGAGEDEDGPEGSEDVENVDRKKNSNESCKNKTEEKEENNKKPLSLQWPDTRCKQAAYLFMLPIIFPLWLTVPNVRDQVRIHTHSKISYDILFVMPQLSTFCFCQTEIQKILCSHLSGLNSVD